MDNQMPRAGIALDGPQAVDVFGTIDMVCPSMVKGYTILRDFLNDEQAPVNIHRLLSSNDVECSHAALVGIIAALFARKTPADVAAFFEVCPELASAVCAYIGVEAIPDPLHLLPPSERVNVDSVRIAHVSDPDVAELVAAMQKA